MFGKDENPLQCEGIKRKLCHGQKGVFSWISVWIPHLMAMKTATKELFLTVKREKNLMEKHLLGGISLGKTEALAIYLDKKAVFGAVFGGISGKTL